ncbi:hypothetical protein I2I11_13585 [Pontibacter sp. 172403-2]|uniref:hypothetical protein n=1 Tax=Pontibacter rufus TaxID=2791028 RepID=UPI0018AF962A|nr:hypothetical protein [Pontibacter sp. 172403-2]MBF9254332.1 hypothetical protein [Pontibacter sp. 172403-2]
MIKKLTPFIFLFFAFQAMGQTKVEWQEGRKLAASDFTGQAPETHSSQSYYLAANLEFGYAMSNYEFMLTKNFNKNVTVYFNPAASWLQEGEDTENLLKYAQMDFDLMELYARKLRKRVYEAKGTFSNYNFFQQAQEEIQAEMAKRQSDMYASTSFDKDKMEAYHQQILTEIAALPDFCKACKPARKKKDKVK